MTPPQKEGHPEDKCQECGSRNPCWSAPNELWNIVVGSPDGILCPRCFQDKADEKGITVHTVVDVSQQKEAEMPVGRITQLSDKPFLQKPPDGEPMVRITVKEYDELVKARAERDKLENLHVELIADIKRILEDTP